MEKPAVLRGLSSERRMDSSSSTPYESAACSPRSSTDRAASSYYSLNAPTCPLTITCDIRSLPAAGMGFVIPSSKASFCEEPSSEDFDFSARFSETDQPWSPTPMSSADELFYNGQIRPLWSNCDDLIHLSSDYDNKVDDDDEDDHFDFRSSADYKFSMFSASHSATSAMNKAQKHVDYGYNGTSHDEYSVHARRQVNNDGKEGARELQRTKRLVENWRASGHDEMSAKQAVMVKVEEIRGTRVGGNKERGIRRSRSLSPLRVFHMDDELPRHSVETGMDEQEEEQGNQMISIKGRRLTLKELLQSSSRTEHMPKQKQREKLQNKAHTEMEMKKNMEGGIALCFKASVKQGLDNKLKGSNHSSQHLPGHQAASMSPHGLHYASHMEQTRQQTFLPYKHGLLGCLGITSKSYRSVAGIRTFHSKSQATTRSARYDSSK